MDSSQIADVLITIMMGIMAIVLCYMMISCSISIIKGKHISFSSCIVSGMVTLFLYGICGTFYFLSAIGVADPALYITAGAAYILAQISMIFTFMTRIKNSFKGSYLAISKCTNNILYGSWIGLIVLGLVLLVSNYILPIVWVGIFASIWILCYITLSILLITLFIRKLQILSLKSDRNQNSFIALDFVDTAIKNGLLVSIAIISSFIFPTIAISLKLTMSTYVRRTAIFWIVLDATVTSLSIFLLFSFNRRIYSVLCFKVHAKCKQIHLGKLDSKSDLRSVNRLPMTNVGSMSEEISADINCAELQTQTNDTVSELNLNLMRGASNPIPSQHRKQVNLSNVSNLPHLILENQVFALSNPVNKTHQSKNNVIIKSTVQSNASSINSNNSNPLPGSSKSNDLGLDSHAYSTSV